MKVPEYFFNRQDESNDANFYVEPRFVTHIDDATIDALTQYYRETLKPEHQVLDLMSSWISHLPQEESYRHITGLGMNQAELDGNPRLDERLVHNLNNEPTLPFHSESFDAVLIAVSVQYLIQPLSIFKEVARVLRPNGFFIVAMSHRLFPTKAIYAFHTMSATDRVNFVSHYMQQTGQMDRVEFLDRSPASADPLWIVQGRRFDRDNN